LKVKNLIKGLIRDHKEDQDQDNSKEHKDIKNNKVDKYKE